jgi:hypothetical protein
MATVAWTVTSVPSKRNLGINPRAYAKNPTPLPLFIPYDVEIPEERKPIRETKKHLHQSH